MKLRASVLAGLATVAHKKCETENFGQCCRFDAFFPLFPSERLRFVAPVGEIEVSSCHPNLVLILNADPHGNP